MKKILPKRILNSILFSFLFLLVFTLNTQGQTNGDGSISLSKTIIPKIDNCRQFDVNLQITGNPQPKLIDVVLVIDRSSSMGWYGNNDIVAAKNAAEEFTNTVFSWNSSNRVAVVSYGNSATLEIGLTSNKNAVLDAIDDISIGFSVQYTNISEGFNLASDQLSGISDDCGLTKSIVMLTDGVANRGAGNCTIEPTSHTDCTIAAYTSGQNAQDDGDVLVYTVGLFSGIDGAVQTVAEETMAWSQNAGYFPTEDAADLSGIYSDIAQDLDWAARQIDDSTPLIDDFVSAGFSIVNNVTATSSAGAGHEGSVYVTPAPGGGTNVNWTKNQIGDETITISYVIEANVDGGECGIVTNPGASWLYYENSNCQPTSLQFDELPYCVPCINITENQFELSDCSCDIIFDADVDTVTCNGGATVKYQWEFFVDGNSVGNYPSTPGDLINENTSGTFTIPDCENINSCGTDNIDGVLTVWYEDDVSDDNCDLTVSETFTTSGVIDHQTPTWNDNDGEETITDVACDETAINNAIATNIPVANDNCDASPSVEMIDSTATPSAGGETIVIVYRATDECGNSTATNGDYTLTLNVVDCCVTTYGTDVQTACDSYTWIDGNTYTSDNNTAQWTLTNAAGCDSIVTLNLTINNSNTGESWETACDSYTWDGGTHTASGDYTYTYQNAAGCDSVHTLHLTIEDTPAIDQPADVTECDSYTLPAITGSNLTGNQAYFTGTGGTGTSYDAGDQITASATLYIYDATANGCSDEVSFDITIEDTPAIDQPADVNECDSYTLPAITGSNLTGNQAYFTGTGGTGTSYDAGDQITASATLYIYDATANGCSDEVSFDITIEDTPAIDQPADVNECDSYTLPAITGSNLTGNQAYFTGTGGTGTSYDAGDQITASATLYIYDATANGCSDEVSFDITIEDTPAIDQPADVTECDSYTLPAITGSNLTGNQAYFTGTGGTGTSYDAGDQITASATLYIYDATANGCSDEVSFDITIEDTPAIDQPADVTECDSYTLPAITGSNLTGNQAYFTGTGGTGTSYDAGDQITASATLYIYDATANGCSDEVSFDITIEDTPAIDQPADVTECDSYTLPAITGSNLTGNQAYFTGTGGTGTSYDAGDQITASATLYIYDATANGCSDEVSFDITIEDTPAIDQPADVTECDSYTLPAITGSNLTGNQAYFTGTGGTGTSYDAGDQITASATLYIYDATANGCSDEVSFDITIEDTPAIDQPADVTECDSYTLPAITGSNLTGNQAYFTGTGGTGTSYDAGDQITASATLYIYDATANGCSDEVSFDITIEDTPAIDQPADVTECDSYTLPAITGSNLTGNQAYFTGTGGTGTSYDAGDQITASATLYIYDATANGCSDEVSFDITIEDTPAIDQPADVNECDSYTLPAITGSNLTGNQAYFTGTGGTGTSYNAGDQITASATLYIYDATANGCSDEVSFDITIEDTPAIDQPADVNECDSYTLPAITGSNLTGNQAYFTGTGGTGTSYNAGDQITASATLYIYDATANGCSDEVSFDITIEDTPAIDQPADVTECDSYTLPAITGSNLTGNQAYFTGTGGTGTSYDAGDQITASATLYIYDATANGCSDEVSFDITIEDTPAIDQPADVNECDSYTLPAITGSNLTGNQAYFTGTGGTGTSYDAGDQITASATLYIYDATANGCSDEVSFDITIEDTPAIDQPADVNECDSYTLPAITGSNLTGNQAYFTGTGGTGTSYDAGDQITASATLYIYDATANGCSDEVSFDITIEDTPAIDQPADVTECDSYTLPAITGSNLTGNQAYFTGTGGTGTSYNAGDQITASATLYIYDATANGCSDEVSFDITIEDTPAIDQPADVNECDSYTLPAITGSNLTGNQAYFTGTGGTGTSYDAGDQITASATLYIYDATANDCSDEVSFDITIEDTPAIDQPADVNECDSYTLPAITGSNLTGNQAYFTGTGGTGTSYDAGDQITASATLYIYDATANGCSDEVSFDITIEDTPAIDQPADVTECDSYTLPAITGSNLTGNQAYFTGTGGTGTSYDAGDQITASATLYIYDATANGCSDEVSFDITIEDTPAIDQPADVNECDSYTLPAITGSNLTGNQAYFTGTGGTGTSYDAGDQITASATLYIYDATANGCSDEVSFDITIEDTPAIDQPADVNECDSYTLPAITGSNLTGNQAYFTGTGGTGTSYDAGDQITASATLYIYDATANGCSDEVSFDITIEDTPAIDQPADVNECDSYTLPAITGSNLTGNQAYFTGTGGTGTSYNAGDQITASATLYIYDATANGCSDEVSFDITIEDTPAIDQPADVNECDSYTLPAITGSNLTGNQAYFTGTGGTGTSYDAGDQITASATLYIYDATANGCSDEVSFDITIEDTPAIDQPADVNECDSYTLPAITGSNLTGNQAYFTGTGGTGTSYDAGDQITASATLYIYDATANGCSDEVSFDITIEDTPAIDQPADVTECDSYTLPAITGSNLTGNQAYFTGTGGTGTSYNAGDQITASATLYIYDATANGCSDEVSFDITIYEDQPPVITEEASDKTVSCEDDYVTELNNWLDNNGGTGEATVTHGEVTWTNNFTGLSDGCGESGSATVTFTATDECGNESTTTATFAVEDNTAPELTIPADVTVECDSETDPASLSSATAIDNCDSNPTVTYSDVVVENPFKNSAVLVLEMNESSGTDLIDESINSLTGVISGSTLYQTGNIDYAHLFNGLSDYSYVPDNDLLSITGPVTFSTWFYSNDLTGYNTISFKQGEYWFYVGRNGDVQVRIYEEGGTSTYTGAKAADGLISTGQWYHLVFTYDNSNAGSGITIYVNGIDETYAVIGNSTISSYFNTSNDLSIGRTIATFGYNYMDGYLDQFIIHGKILSESERNELYNSGDGNPYSNWSDGCSGNFLIERTWTATDECGNSTSAKQIITVEDNTAPELTIPDDIAIVCGEDSSPAATGTATATDNCSSEISITYTDEVTQGDCLEEIKRTWTAIDECGNTASAVQTITIEEKVISVEITGNEQLTCSNTIVTLDATTENVMYLWSTGATTPTIEVTEPGEYSVIVTDSACGCSLAYDTVIVDEAPSDISVEIVADELICYNESNGVATAIASGGVGPYSYVWSNGSTNQTIGGLSAGSYTVTVTDVNGCSTSLSVIISENDELVTMTTLISPAECGIPNSGSATVTVISGGSGNYSYSWDNGSTTKTVSNLSAGVHSVVVTDLLTNCSDNATVLISEDDTQAPTIICPEDIDTIITSEMCEVELTIPVPEVSDNCSIGILTNSFNDSDDASGIYPAGVTIIQWIVTDNSGNADTCEQTIVVKSVPVANDDMVEVSENTPLTVEPIENDSDCDDNIDSATLEIITQPSNGTVSDIDLINGTLIYSPEEGFTGTDTILYKICDEDNLCAEAYIVITVKSTLDTDNDNVPNDIDVDDDNDGILDIDETLIADSDNDGIPNYLDIDSDNDGILDNIEAQAEGTYREPLWSDLDGDGWDDQYDPDNGGSYFDLADTDNDGDPDYIDTDSDDDGVDDYIEGFDVTGPQGINDSIPDIYPAGTDTDLDGLDDNYDDIDGKDVYNNPIGGNAPLPDYDNDGVRAWRDADDKTPGGDDNPVLGCELIIPNGFSPDGDPYNEYFKIVYECDQGEQTFGEINPNAKMMIYNRWGNLVYEKEGYGNITRHGEADAWWNGSSDNNWTVGNNKVPVATYVYVLILDDGDVYKGTVYVNY